MRNNDADRWVGSTSGRTRQGTVVSGARWPLPPEVYRRRRWAALGVLVVAVVTVVMLVTTIVGGGDGAGNTTASDSAVDGSAGDAGDTGTLLTGEGGVLEASASAGPLPGVPVASTVGALPPGGEVTQRGHGTWHGVGVVGAVAGDPQAEGTRTITYVVEVEDGLDTASFGGGDSFSAMVDATLADPRSWIGTKGGEVAGGGGSGGRIAFRHISVADTDTDTPDLRIRLTTPGTTRDLCGGEIDLETSCFVGGGDRSGDAARGRVVINVARWVRGAATFAGDLGSYRQYVLNHEIGHGIGYASHQPCPGDGVLAPVMMQQTLSLNNRDLVELDAGAEYMPEDRGGADHEARWDAVCVANAWPHPEG